MNTDIDRTVGEWSDNSRIFEYYVPNKSAMIRQKEILCKGATKIIRLEDKLVYVIENRIVSPEVPYSDCFVLVFRYCITWVSETNCRLKISIMADFIKQTRMKSIIFNLRSVYQRKCDGWNE